MSRRPVSSCWGLIWSASQTISPPQTLLKSCESLFWPFIIKTKINRILPCTISKQTNTLCILGATLCQRLLNSEVSRQQLVKRNVPPCCQRESVGHLSSRTQTGVAASLMTTCWGSCFLLTLPDILLASCCSASA